MERIPVRVGRGCGRLAHGAHPGARRAWVWTLGVWTFQWVDFGKGLEAIMTMSIKRRPMDRIQVPVGRGCGPWADGAQVGVSGAEWGGGWTMGRDCRGS
eukprot:354038-Chlamydomonas_euryale.AAC.5